MRKAATSLNGNSIISARLYAYGKQANSHDLYKVVGLSLMLLDHIGLYFFDNNLLLRTLGRASAPIFFFLLGYQGKLHITLGLWLMALLLSLSTMYLYGHFWLNILFNFLAIHVALHYLRFKNLSTTTLFLLFTALFIGNFYLQTILEYGLMGFSISYSAQLIKRHDPRGGLALAASLAYYGWQKSIAFGLGSHLGLQLLLLTELSLLGYLLYHYRLTIFPLRGPLRLACLFVARYSLLIYFSHLFGFQLWYILQH